jgi:hypothetical protein
LTPYQIVAYLRGGPGNQILTKQTQYIGNFIGVYRAIYCGNGLKHTLPIIPSPRPFLKLVIPQGGPQRVDES